MKWKIHSITRDKDFGIAKEKLLVLLDHCVPETKNEPIPGKCHSNPYEKHQVGQRTASMIITIWFLFTYSL
jgi:hypothetical protein